MFHLNSIQNTQEEIDFVFNLISISLTFVAITFISSILANKKPRKTELNIFHSSAYFLSSTLFTFIFLLANYLNADSEIDSFLFILKFIPTQYK